MGPFVSSCGNTYILVAVDNVSKWVEAMALPNNEARSVVAFLKKSIFMRFDIPRAIISDGGSHFYNKAFDSLLVKYGVNHKDRLVEKIGWCSLGLSDKLQDSDWHVPVPVGVWESLPSSGGVST
ncbi:uncharacterized protein [Nicotiana sylvestris]|uniref:uncharacterized protein n=1 Tax=Nicotiana sylvestris TaxID=4096 RepID=UPI00388C4539